MPIQNLFAEIRNIITDTDPGFLSIKNKFIDKYIDNYNDYPKINDNWEANKRESIRNVINGIKNGEIQSDNDLKIFFNQNIINTDPVLTPLKNIPNIRLIINTCLSQELFADPTQQQIDEIGRDKKIKFLTFVIILKHIKNPRKFPLNWKAYRYILRNIYRYDGTFEKPSDIPDIYNALNINIEDDDCGLIFTSIMEYILNILIPNAFNDKSQQLKISLNNNNSDEFKHFFRINRNNIKKYNNKEPGIKTVAKIICKKYNKFNPLLLIEPLEDEEYPDDNEEENKKKENIMETKNHINIILYGPPGTGKTYNTIDIAAKIISDNEKITSKMIDDIIKKSDHDKSKQIFDDEFNKRIFFVSFHQNYSYEEFIVGIRPELSNKNRPDNLEPEQKNKTGTENTKNRPDNSESEQQNKTGTENTSSNNKSVSNDGIKFEWAYGIFLKACAAAYKYAEDENFKEEIKKSHVVDYMYYLNKKQNNIKDFFKDKPKVVLILDEINRANISRVFGELITLIEDDKRLGAEHDMILTIPNGDNFAVPANLVVLGTMNTADRSIAFIDVALRRRFYFHPLFPNKGKITDPVKGEFMELLNKFIKEKKGRDFQIGHSYFMNDYDTASIINESIIPLLFEYFPNKKDDVLEKELKNIKVNCKENDKTFVYKFDTRIDGLLKFIKEELPKETEPKSEDSVTKESTDRSSVE